MKKILFPLMGIIFLTSCAPGNYFLFYKLEKFENGKMTRNGNIYYSLCERGKERVIDMQSMSFELPELFKNAPCNDWNKYIYHSTDDSLNVSIPSVIEYNNLAMIGAGGYRMGFKAGILYSPINKKWELKENIFSPEVFLEYKRDWYKYHKEIPLESGWVDTWPGGRCARLQFLSANLIQYFHRVEYYCWPYSSEEKQQPPFYIGASQSISQDKGIPHPFVFADLDNELIKPVLDSLEVYPLPDEAIQFIAYRFNNICNSRHIAYYGKGDDLSSEFPDRRMTLHGMRDCGYDVPDPRISVDSYDEIFEKTEYDKFTQDGGRLAPKDYQLIKIFSQGISLSRHSNTTWYIYKIPHEKFARIEQKLLMLDVLKETEIVARKFIDYSKPSPWKALPSFVVAYDAWYYIPPKYRRFRTNSFSQETHRVGFGFRYDEELNARVIDINFDSDTVSGYNFVTLVEGD